MAKILCAAGIIVVACACGGTRGATWYVDKSALKGGDGTSWEKAFRMIQKGMGKAEEGDTVMVAEGLYVENIGFGGKNIVLRSTDPNDWSVVAKTIIDGNQAGSVVAFAGTEDETCVLAGFTIRNGTGNDFVSPSGTWPGGGGILGGDHYESRTGATIQNNLIVENSAHDGAGIALCDGLIRNNVLIGNHANPSWPGGGLLMCNGIIEGNLVAGNTSNCGGGISHCNAVIRNNTVVGNFATTDGGGLSFCGTRDFAPPGATITNNIVWRNESPLGPQIHNSDPATYCCIQDWSGGGEGNIGADPCFVDPDGADGDPETYEDNDYRLSPGSSCIGTGENEDWMSEAVDLDGNPRISFGAGDIGAYEFPFSIVGVVREDGGNVQLTWNARAGGSYIVRSCVSLFGGEWAEEAVVQTKGRSGGWTDPDVAPPPRKFYRIEAE